MTMQPKQISSWESFDAIHKYVENEYVKSWLLESGPITKRIGLQRKFKLELLSDSIADVENQDQEFLGSKSKEFKVREVILHGDDTPIVFARTIIPVLTIEDGLEELGRLGSKPLGDILFERKIFQKKDSVYASFEYKQNSFWGRKIKYLVNEQPFSVMEIFLFKNEI